MYLIFVVMGFFDGLDAYWPAIIGITFLYITGRWIYRLYVHPLASFPGPKLWAMSLWPEWYWDAVKRGQYIFRIIEAHEKYGKLPCPFKTRIKR